MVRQSLSRRHLCILFFFYLLNAFLTQGFLCSSKTLMSIFQHSSLSWMFQFIPSFCLSCILSTASCNSLSGCYHSRLPFTVTYSRSDCHTEPQVCNTSDISEFSTNYFPSISSHPRAEARII